MADTGEAEAVTMTGGVSFFFFFCLSRVHTEMHFFTHPLMHHADELKFSSFIWLTALFFFFFGPVWFDSSFIMWYLISI